MYDNIVIPVDGSEVAKRAARVGLGLAKTCDATVDVLYVVERGMLDRATSQRAKEGLRERGETALAEIEDVAAEFDYPVTTHIVEGTPSAAINEFVAERDAELVVMGRHGQRTVSERILGGVTEQVLHRGEVPVLVVPEAGTSTVAHGGFDRILVPTDGSENGEVATDHAAALAEQYGSAVHVLNVVDTQAAGGVFDAGGLTEEFVERLEADGREAVERVADEIAETAPEADVETAAVRGKPDHGIRDYASEQDVDLVVMGSHGRSNLGRQLLGSVTSEVLRLVPVPVLVVKREEA